MPSVFLTADPHFGHSGVCRFLRDDGSKLRPYETAEEMDEDMVQRWNDTVRPADKVYVLGDLVINRKALKIMHRLNGSKVLIKGNHDIFKLEDYTPHFRDIRGYHVMNGLILSHIPIHEESLGRFSKNIHGHLHYRNVMRVKHPGATPEIDPRYWCVSVEHTDYRPILFEEVLKKIKERDEALNFKDVRVSILGPD